MVHFNYRTALYFFIAIFNCIAHTNITCKQQSSEKTKVYIMYSPSHAEMANEWFKTSVMTHDQDCEVIETILPQECPSGRFYEKGWKGVMIKKLDLLINATNENMGKVFIYADVDIQFFAPFSQYAIKCLGNKDVVFQQDSRQHGITACAGFIVCRANQATLSLWKNAKALMENGQAECDQRALWQVLNLSDHAKRNPTLQNRYAVKNLNWGLLPWQEFFGPGMAAQKSWKSAAWSPGDYFSVPSKIIMHHANFTVGLDNKIKQLSLVQNTIHNKTPSERIRSY